MISILRLIFILFLSLALTPVYLGLGLVLLLTGGLGYLRFSRARTDAPPPARETASLIILNWNGKELLAEGLPSVLRAVARDGRPHEVLVVDNGSADGSVAFVQERFPSVRVLALPENLGFGEGNNRGVAAARNDIVILLNNDMVLDENFIRPLLDGFADDDTFAVTGQIFFQDPARRREETGKTSGRFARGQIEVTHEPVLDSDPGRAYPPVLWAGGGSTAYDRRKFLALDGFHKLFSPAYVEDVDLSYRAWKRGWKSLFTAQSIVYHKHRASSNKRFGRRRVDALVRRNHFIFFWKNITDARMTLVHTLYLPWIMYRSLWDGGLLQLGAFLSALARLPIFLPDRWRLAARAFSSDPYILTHTRERWRYFQRSAEVSAPPAASARPPLKILMLTSYLPHRGFHAGGVRMYELIRCLSTRHPITLVTFLETEAERSLVAEVAPFCADVQAVLRQPPFPNHLYPYEPYAEFRTREMEETVRYALDARRYDIIHCEYTQMVQYLPDDLAAKKVFTNHEVGFAAHYRKYAHATGAFRRTKAFYNYLQILNREVRACARVDKVICVSQEDADALGRYVAPRKIAVATMGVDLDYFRPDMLPADGAAENEQSLVFVGGFRHYPNVDGMRFFHQAIWPIIRKQAPGVRFYIVGSHPPDEILQLGREENIIVTGQVADLRPYLARAAVFVVPLRLGVGMRGKVLEAWAMHKPVVVTRLACAGLSAAVDGENLYIADEPDLFADRVLYLLRHPEERARLGANAGRAIRAYDWKQISEQVEAAYYNLL